MISVCMATYNGEKYIKDQIESILKQLGREDELIISDDNSTDQTLEIINQLNDNRIRVKKNIRQHGYTGNFYNALKFAKGDYIFLSDQDDIWRPNKIMKTMRYLKKYNFVVSDAKEVDTDLKEINKSRILCYGMQKGFWSNLIRSRYIGCCMAFDKNVLKSIFPPPTYQNKYPHDLWIALIGEGYFKSFLIREPLILYRRHGNNASNGGVADKGTIFLFIRRILKRFYYLFYFIKQYAHVRKVKKGLV